MEAKKDIDPDQQSGHQHLFRPIRTAIFRGLGVVLPPLLTIVIFFWIFGTINQYVLGPLTGGTRDLLVVAYKDIRQPIPAKNLTEDQRGKQSIVVKGEAYQRHEGGSFYYPKRYQLLPDGTYVPSPVYNRVIGDFKKSDFPDGIEIYQRWVDVTYLQTWKVVLVFLCLFILVLYLLGKFMAAGVGRFFWSLFERVITRVPLVRNVYSAVKQVSDFLLSQQSIEYSRVVAVEWPRKEIWTLALVTGPSLKDVRAAANEDVLSVLIPTSPMPMTGFTVTVKKSETVDLNISMEEAIQFIVSCGVVVPPDHINRLPAPDETVPQATVTEDGKDSKKGEKDQTPNASP